MSFPMLGIRVALKIIWLVVDLPLVGNMLLMVNMVIIWLMMVNN